MRTDPILVIEDDAGVRETLVDILEDRGHSVIAVSSVAEALARAPESGVALVDLRLPDGSGIDLARRLREAHPNFDMIFVTANASLDSAIGAVEVGAVRYLQKPCPPSVLLRVLDETLHRRKLERVAAQQSRRIEAVARLAPRLLTTLSVEETCAIGLEEIVAVTAAAGARFHTNARSAGEAIDYAQTAGPATEIEITGAETRLTLFGATSPDRALLELMGAQLTSAVLTAAKHEALVDAHARVQATQRTMVEAEKQLAVGRLAAGIAHEIGTPLNIISGRAEMLLERSEEGPMQRGLKIIHTQVDRIAGLVRQLLDFSRAETDERATIRLATVLAETLPLVETRAMKRMAKVVNRVPDSPCSVHGSLSQLQQVVLNLILNAVDEGANEIVLECARLDPHTLELRVTDDGPGVPPDRLEEIFEPFVTTKPRGSGTGLGLAVVRGIVNDHGGTIHAENAPHGGASFVVRLPAAN